MKVLASAIEAHYALGTTTLATALRITRKGLTPSDDEHFGFTTHDESTDIDGVEYQAGPGLIIGEIVTAANLDVGNLELSTLHDETIFTTVDILGGRWRKAEFLIFRYNWDTDVALSIDDCDPLLAGTVGNIEIRQNMIVAELRDLRQFLQEPVGDNSSKTCRARLGDDRCRKDLSAFTVTGTITSVTSNQVFQDSSRAEAADYFGEGEIRFDTGDNAGLAAKVKSYAANGTFTLALPMFAPVEVGDTYTAIAGCRKRLEEDCKTKFDNVVNFVGEPHRKGINDLTKAPPREV